MKHTTYKPDRFKIEQDEQHAIYFMKSFSAGVVGCLLIYTACFYAQEIDDLFAWVLKVWWL